MVGVAERTLSEVDVVLWLVEPTNYIGAGEQHIIEQLKKLFAVYGCSPETQHLLIQISTIPNIQFGFEKAKK